MKRRTLLSLAVAGFASPSMVLAGGGIVHYSRSAYNEAVASGEPLLLDFYSPS